MQKNIQSRWGGWHIKARPEEKNVIIQDGEDPLDAEHLMRCLENVTPNTSKPRGTTFPYALAVLSSSEKIHYADAVPRALPMLVEDDLQKVVVLLYGIPHEANEALESFLETCHVKPSVAVWVETHNEDSDLIYSPVRQR
jgi:hypothetical protein